MKPGDRVKVISAESEWWGMAGLMLFCNRQGRPVVRLDNCGLDVDFDPHELELEALVDA